MIFIQLCGKKGRGKYAIIDDDDFNKVKNYKWYYYESKYGTGYAITHTYINNIKTTIRMHRIILNASQGELVDHKNHDGLDNRKNNLRLCNHLENNRNRKLSYNSKHSIYKGVHPTCNKTWTSTIIVNKEKMRIGIFRTEVEAAHAYDYYAIKYFGKFAALNFPDYDYSKYEPQPYKRKTSKYRGIQWCPKRKKWRVSRQINKKRVRIGDYKTEKEAAMAYDEYLIKNNIRNGLNFPHA